MSSLTLTVVVATYQGSAYVEAQIQSIIEQTHLPDEVIVFDDGSLDDTHSRVVALLGSSSLNWRIFRGVNVGVNANFERACKHATCDIIVFSDQDDVWHPTKLARVEAAFAQAPHASLVMTDAYLKTDTIEDGHSASPTLWKQLRFSRRQQRLAQTDSAFKIMSRKIVFYGCTMAVRSVVVNSAMPFTSYTAFDSWVGLCAVLSGEVVLIRTPLICYRQHSAQVTGLVRGSISRRIRHRLVRATATDAANEIARVDELLKRFASWAPDPRTVDALQVLESRRKFVVERERIRSLPRNKRPRQILATFFSGSYSRGAQGIRSAALDLISAFIDHPGA